MKDYLHFFVPTSAVSNSAGRKHQIRRLYAVQGKPNIRKLMGLFHNSHRDTLPENSILRTYSQGNFQTVKNSIEGIRREGRRQSMLSGVREGIGNVSGYITTRQFCDPDPTCSEGHFDMVGLSPRRIKRELDEIAPYFSGQSKVDLYVSALSSSKPDHDVAKRILDKKMGELSALIGESGKRADASFDELMAIPTKPTPNKDQNKPGFLRSLFGKRCA